MFNQYIKNTAYSAWKICLSFCLVIAILSNMNIVNAADDSSSDNTTNPFGSQLCRLVNTLNGNIARSIAVVAIFALGIGLISGKLQWQMAAITACGIITIFSAPQVVAWMSGTDIGSTGGKLDCSSTT